MSKTLKITTVSDAHRELLERALVAFDLNRTEAAKALGISVRTVRNWIKEFKLTDQFPSKSGRDQKTVGKSGG